MFVCLSVGMLEKRKIGMQAEESLHCDAQSRQVSFSYQNETGKTERGEGKRGRKREREIRIKRVVIERL
jgi:hypothetical protein